MNGSFRETRLRSLLLGCGLIAALGGCRASGLPDFDPMTPIPETPPSEVEAVVFLIGDAGDATVGRSPLLRRLRQDVERWSGELQRDSAVSVVYLGDIIYPVGMRARGSGFRQDSTRLWSQINVVGGPNAREHATVGWFLAGNHDWGNLTGEAGIRRLTRLENAIATARETGPRVALLPAAGDPGPAVRDIRSDVRLIMIDTHWFLQERSDEAKDAFFAKVATALEDAGEREVIMAAHHPYYSAGPHGPTALGTKALGLDFLLKKSGALIQDLNSPVYDDFIARLRATFAASGKPPLIFAGGHDHSLQVLAGGGGSDPVHVLVSGSGSKLTRLSEFTALRFGASRPGYMMLVFRRDEGVELFVQAGRRSPLTCPASPDARREQCMTDGAAAFETIYSEQVFYPAGDPRRIPGDHTDSGSKQPRDG